jgi:hypothetical protein
MTSPNRLAAASTLAEWSNLANEAAFYFAQAGDEHAGRRLAVLAAALHGAAEAFEEDARNLGEFVAGEAKGAD